MTSSESEHIFIFISISVSSSGSNNNSGSDFYPSNPYSTQYTGPGAGTGYNSVSGPAYSAYSSPAGGVTSK